MTARPVALSVAFFALVLLVVCGSRSLRADTPLCSSSTKAMNRACTKDEVPGKCEVSEALDPNGNPQCNQAFAVRTVYTDLFDCMLTDNPPLSPPGVWGYICVGEWEDNGSGQLVQVKRACIDVSACIPSRGLSGQPICVYGATITTITNPVNTTILCTLTYA